MMHVRRATLIGIFVHNRTKNMRSDKRLITKKTLFKITKNTVANFNNGDS